jgi:precorrin-2/cobalt-factor-2 C20-methyltransferase
MTGVLHVVGVGPGDPELMTMRAVRVIGASPVVAHFCKGGRAGHARSVAWAYVAASAIELRFAYPFTTEISVADPRYPSEMAIFYEKCAEVLSAHLTDGRDVALICEGDPFFYGSAMYLYDRLRARHPVQVTPGVTGMSGSWSRAGTPMTHGDDVLAILPGTLPLDELVGRLGACDAAVIMKLGSNLPKIRVALDRAGLTARAIYVERATMAGEIIVPFADLDRDKVPYFALVLIPGRQGPR